MKLISSLSSIQRLLLLSAHLGYYVELLHLLSTIIQKAIKRQKLNPKTLSFAIYHHLGLGLG